MQGCEGGQEELAFWWEGEGGVEGRSPGQSEAGPERLQALGEMDISAPAALRKWLPMHPVSNGFPHLRMAERDGELSVSNCNVPTSHPVKSC